ncbi:MAG: hypothetical protein HQL16_07910 [Candidatus Omnitrophica bacterium]|nr:hypothetical protein [Candidatus Omnitrophota bacterium]
MALLKSRLILRLVSWILIISFGSSCAFSSPVYAQSLNLPSPGTMVLSSPAYMPTMMKGLKVHPENPLLFDFVLDTGKSGLKLDSKEFKAESEKLIKYFLASLTIKETDLWVNLSPYEKDRMATEELGATELGRDMLAQDYILKQLTASLIYPEKDLGKSFWDKVYAKAQAQFGTSDIPVDTFNKVWIVADKAKVLEKNNAAYVVGSHLKVMLETDYLAQEKSVGAQFIAPGTQAPGRGNKVEGSSEGQELAKQVIREVVIPEIEKEVNEGQNFAPLRQMFYAMILASWYKLALKDAFLNQVYANKNKTSGVLSDDPAVKEKIYSQYLDAYKKGVFNYIKESTDTATGETIPRKYFSGGLQLMKDPAQVIDRVQSLSPGDTIAGIGNVVVVTTNIARSKTRTVAAKTNRAQQSDAAMSRRSFLKWTALGAATIGGFAWMRRSYNQFQEKQLAQLTQKEEELTSAPVSAAPSMPVPLGIPTLAKNISARIAQEGGIASSKAVVQLTIAAIGWSMDAERVIGLANAIKAALPKDDGDITWDALAELAFATAANRKSGVHVAKVAQALKAKMKADNVVISWEAASQLTIAKEIADISIDQTAGLTHAIKAEFTKDKMEISAEAMSSLAIASAIRRMPAAQVVPLAKDIKAEIAQQDPSISWEAVAQLTIAAALKSWRASQLVAVAQGVRAKIERDGGITWQGLTIPLGQGEKVSWDIIAILTIASTFGNSDAAQSAGSSLDGAKQLLVDYQKTGSIMGPPGVIVADYLQQIAEGVKNFDSHNVVSSLSTKGYLRGNISLQEAARKLHDADAALDEQPAVELLVTLRAGYIYNLRGEALTELFQRVQGEKIFEVFYGGNQRRPVVARGLKKILVLEDDPQRARDIREEVEAIFGKAVEVIIQSDVVQAKKVLTIQGQTIDALVGSMRYGVNNPAELPRSERDNTFLGLVEHPLGENLPVIVLTSSQNARLIDGLRSKYGERVSIAFMPKPGELSALSEQLKVIDEKLKNADAAQGAVTGEMLDFAKTLLQEHNVVKKDSLSEKRPFSDYVSVVALRSKNFSYGDFIRLPAVEQYLKGLVSLEAAAQQLRQESPQPLAERLAVELLVTLRVNYGLGLAGTNNLQALLNQMRSERFFEKYYAGQARPAIQGLGTVLVWDPDFDALQSLRKAIQSAFPDVNVVALPTLAKSEKVIEEQGGSVDLIVGRIPYGWHNPLTFGRKERARTFLRLLNRYDGQAVLISQSRDVRRIVGEEYADRVTPVFFSESENYSPLISALQKVDEKLKSSDAAMQRLTDEEKGVAREMGLSTKAEFALIVLKNNGIAPMVVLRLIEEFEGKIVSAEKLLHFAAWNQNAKSPLNDYGHIMMLSDLERIRRAPGDMILNSGSKEAYHLIKVTRNNFLRLLMDVYRVDPNVVFDFVFGERAVGPKIYKAQQAPFSFPFSSSAATRFINLIFDGQNFFKVETFMDGHGWHWYVNGVPYGMDLTPDDALAYDGHGRIVFTQKMNRDEPVVVLRLSGQGVERAAKDIVKKHTAGTLLGTPSQYKNSHFIDENVWRFAHTRPVLQETEERKAEMTVDVGAIASEMDGVSVAPKFQPIEQGAPVTLRGSREQVDRRGERTGRVFAYVADPFSDGILYLVKWDADQQIKDKKLEAIKGKFQSLSELQSQLQGLALGSNNRKRRELISAAKSLVASLKAGFSGYGEFLSGGQLLELLTEINPVELANAEAQIQKGMALLESLERENQGMTFEFGYDLRKLDSPGDGDSAMANHFSEMRLRRLELHQLEVWKSRSQNRRMPEEIKARAEMTLQSLRDGLVKYAAFSSARRLMDLLSPEKIDGRLEGVSFSLAFGELERLENQIHDWDVSPKGKIVDLGSLSLPVVIKKDQKILYTFRNGWRVELEERNNTTRALVRKGDQDIFSIEYPEWKPDRKWEDVVNDINAMYGERLAGKDTAPAVQKALAESSGGRVVVIVNAPLEESSDVVLAALENNPNVMVLHGPLSDGRPASFGVEAKDLYDNGFWVDEKRGFVNLSNLREGATRQRLREALAPLKKPRSTQMVNYKSRVAKVQPATIGMLPRNVPLLGLRVAWEERLVVNQKGQPDQEFILYEDVPVFPDDSDGDEPVFTRGANVVGLTKEGEAFWKEAIAQASVVIMLGEHVGGIDHVLKGEVLGQKRLRVDHSDLQWMKELAQPSLWKASSLSSDNAMQTTPGGIDLNAKNMGLDVRRDGKGIDMRFDPALFEQFTRGDFSGVVPVILRMTPVQNPLSILNLN